MLFLTLRDYNPFILIEKFIVILVKPESVGEKIQKIQQPFIEHLTMFYILFSYLDMYLSVNNKMAIIMNHKYQPG